MDGIDVLSSGVEDLASEGGVYMILDYESMKRNSQRSQNLAKLNMMTSSICIGSFRLSFMHMALVGIFHH